jgi:hypothetical protein
MECPVIMERQTPIDVFIHSTKKKVSSSKGSYYYTLKQINTDMTILIILCLTGDINTCKWRKM